MTYNSKIIVGMAAALALAGGVVGIAHAQAGSLSAALAAGEVGEQADGYLGFRTPPSAAVKAEVDAINIKRRAAYTELAAKRGVSVSDMAAATGCLTLTTKVGPGRAYRSSNGEWSIRNGNAPVPKPDYCPSVG